MLGVPVFCEIRLGNLIPESIHKISDDGVCRSETFNIPLP